MIAAPPSTSHPVGSICWIDLGVADVDAAASLYRALLGWAIGPPDPSGHLFASLRGHLIAALGCELASYLVLSVRTDIPTPREQDLHLRELINSAVSSGTVTVSRGKLDRRRPPPL